ncbi:ATP-binding protein [Aeromonas dhakensis]|uniref:HAMP domain-containing sensor histidine kinase n=1 Tax=Aeromonas dhakensis TaxID=196024 RepID=UPI0018A797BE|nr:ATP-binding protein [Aeromonas dhakensis]MBF8451585.1 HAMP domain-containing protein [Aeromonas dhakensis]
MILKGRLFWKILFGFWFTIIMMSQLLWVAFSLYRHEGPPEQRMASQLAERQLEAAASLLQRQGPAAVAALQASWPAQERRLLQLEPITTEPATTLSGRILPGADGQRYRLDYDGAGLQQLLAPPQPHRNWLNMPPPMWWIGGLGGLFFSALLAWHLTRPMNRFRQGFARLAQGELDVRLYPAMRRRHDEISDAARDFDAMAERLQLLVESREQLLHDVSHELRSPLARLQLAIGLAQQDPARIEGSLERIQLETQRMDKMIGELLTLTRAGHGERDGEEYYDLQGLVDAVVSDARYEAQHMGVEIKTWVDETREYTVCGQAELIRRALDNVLRNALRFSQAGQCIHLTLMHQGCEFVIEVADQGMGVDESKLSSIFDPFVRIGSPAAGKGYGLGLAITRKAIQAQGGRVDARNGEEGGLIVTLHLPG